MKLQYGNGRLSPADDRVVKVRRGWRVTRLNGAACCPAGHYKPELAAECARAKGMLA